MSLTIIDDPSPNHSERNASISMIILHYTGMETGPEALERLKDVDWQVSSHYLVYEDGTLYRLVDESRKAWHAGVSHWRGQDNLNRVSIGIEICNPGHEFGYRPFPEVQMNVVAELVNEIVHRYNITPGNVIGHSDIAPARKVDPGELFDWDRLAGMGLVLAKPINILDPQWSDSIFMEKLKQFGYLTSVGQHISLRAFQRRFRPSLVDGEIDAECRSILAGLLATKFD